MQPLETALRLARESGLDLVEVTAKAAFPVCKIVDYAKFKYVQKQKEKRHKANLVKVVCKEIRLSARIDDHDFSFKRQHAIRFLEEGADVKAFVQFRGREMSFQENGRANLDKLLEALEKAGGSIKQAPKMTGRRLIAFIESKKKTKVPKPLCQKPNNTAVQPNVSP